jgi:dipeptidyl aminopeptidase/acylaminoacyl peptidase
LLRGLIGMPPKAKQSGGPYAQAAGEEPRSCFSLMENPLRFPPAVAYDAAMRNLTCCPALCALAGACFLVTVSARAQKPGFPSNEDLRLVRSLSGPQLSPNGKDVLLEVADSTAKGGKEHLWLINIQQNTARQLTFTPVKDSSADLRGEYDASWMPDGGSVLFLAHRGKHTQLFRLPMDGGEGRPYDLKVLPRVDESKAPDVIPPVKNPTTEKAAPLEIDVAYYSVSPNGKFIAITARDPETPGEREELEEKADAVWVDHNPHGTRLYLLNPADGKLTPTGVPPNVRRVAWSKQGNRLVAIASGMNHLAELHPANSAWLLDVSHPAHPEKLKEIPATVEGGTWSEDGRAFYFLAQSVADTPPGYDDLYALHFSGAKVADLTGGFSGSLGYGLPIATRTGVLQTVQIGTSVTMLEALGRTHRVLHFPMTVVRQLETNAKQTGWVWLGTGSTTPTTLYYDARLGDQPIALHAPSVIPAAWTPVKAKIVHWTNEGFRLEGLLYLPPQANAGHKVPLIVDVHGGPTGAWVDDYSQFNEFLLGHGWAVFEPNPRGSTGYGAKFVAANHNDLGGGDYRDIMTGVDAVVAHDPIDSTRMALMGYSYGGEMAGFVEGKTARFKAIIAGAPVIDQESEYGTESGSWYDRWFYGLPWEHAAAAWRQSPLAWAAHAKTPMLLLQGEADTTDPLGQSEEMYRALRQMGVLVDLIEYPRENHVPLAEGIFGMPSPEPWHGFDARQRIVQFINAAFAK